MWAIIRIVILFGNGQILIENALHSFSFRDVNLAYGPVLHGHGPKLEIVSNESEQPVPWVYCKLANQS